MPLTTDLIESNDPSLESLDTFLDKKEEQSPMPQKVINKKAAVTAAALPGNDLEGTYRNIKFDLETKGTSVHVDQLTDQEKQEAQLEDQVAAQEIINSEDFFPEEKVQQLEKLRELRERYPDRSDSEIFIDLQINNLNEDTSSRKAHVDGLIKDYSKLNETRSIIDAIQADVRLGFKPIEKNLGATFMEFFASSYAPGFGALLTGLVEDIDPGSTDITDAIAPGEAVRRLKVKFNDASIEQKRAFINRLGKVAEENSGFLIEDRVLAREYLDMFVEDLDPTLSELQTEAYIHNVFSALDLVPLFWNASVKGLTGAVRKTIPPRVLSKVLNGSGKAKRNTVGGMLIEVNPEEAKVQFLDSIVNHNAEKLEALGVDIDEAVNSLVLHLDDGSEIPIGPDLNDRLYTMLEQDVLGEGTIGIAFDAEQKLASQDRLISRLNKVTKESDGVELLSKTLIKPVTGGFRARVAIGASDTTGFPTVAQAQRASEMYIETTSGASVKFWRANRAKGTYDEIGPNEFQALKENEEDVGDYLFTIEVKHSYGPEDAGKFKNEVVGISGKAAKFADPKTVFRTIGAAINVAGDQSDRIKKSLHERLKPLTDLPSRKQTKVLDIIDDGVRFKNPDGSTGKWFDEEELTRKLRKKGVNNNDDLKDMIAAYNAKRLYEKEIFAHNDRRLRARLDRDGQKSIFIKLDDEGTNFFETMGKPFATANEVQEGTVIYSPGFGDEFLAITPEQLKDFYKEGFQVVKFRYPTDIRGDGRKASHILVNKSGGDKIRPLPSVVSKELEGYSTTAYDANYVVKEEFIDNIDGVDTPALRTISIEDNRLDAERVRDSLAEADSREGGKRKFVALEARELRDIEYVQGASEDFYHDRGQLFFSKRSKDEVRSFSSKRTVKSIGETVDLAINNVSKHVAMDTTIETLMRRWENTYGHLTKDGRFPKNASDIVRPRDVGLQQDWKDAVALQERVNFLVGTDKGKIHEWKTNSIIKMAEVLANTSDHAVWQKASAALLNNKDKALLSPIDTMKNIAFLRYIVLNPVKQAIMQANSATLYLGVEGGSKYMFGQGAKDLAGILMGQGMDKGSATWNAMAPRIAKAMNMSTKEYGQFLDAYKRTGLQDAISSHQFLASMALDKRVTGDTGLMRGLVRDAIENLKRGVALSRGGFEFGESVNISNAFLIARNEWILKQRQLVRAGSATGRPSKTWMQKDNLDQIAARARELSLNMNQVSATQFQKGGFGAIFQFTSHAHKSLQAIIPDWELFGLNKVAGKAFTNKEKRNIVLGQSMLYGTASIPFFNGMLDHAIQEAGIVVDADFKNALEEGVFFESLVFAMDQLTGEDSAPALSKQLAPLQATVSEANPIHKLSAAIGTTLYELARNKDLTALNTLKGPGVSATWEVAQTLTHMGWLAGAVDLDKDDPDKMWLLLEEAAKLVPLFSQAFKSRLVNEAGVLANKYGDPQLKITTNELIFKSILGTESKREEELRELGQDLRGTGFRPSEGSVEEEYRGVAKWLFEHTKKLAAQLKDGGGGLDTDTFFNKIKTSRQIIKFVYSAGDARTILNMYDEMANKQISTDPTQTKASSLRDDILDAMLGDKPTLFSDSTLINKIQNSKLFQSAPEEQAFLELIMGSPSDSPSFVEEVERLTE